MNTGYRFAPTIAAGISTLPDFDLTDLCAARATARQASASMPPVDTTGTVVEERLVPGFAADPQVRVRVYRPSGEAAGPSGEAAGPSGAPAILHVHGGGFVLGTLDGSHARCTRLVRVLGAVLVSVDYRLAPEHPYPAALHDVLAVLEWIAANAGELGIDRSRIAIHGVSAGAGLAAATALFARDHGGPALCFQYLGIPELDDRLETRSMQRFTDTPSWDRSKADISWTAYLGDGIRGSETVSPYAAPSRAVDLSNLPPTYISVMEFDPLRDEGIAYAQALLDAGVPVELHAFPGTFHGSSGLVDAPITRRELDEEVYALQAGLQAEVSSATTKELSRHGY